MSSHQQGDSADMPDTETVELAQKESKENKEKAEAFQKLFEYYKNGIYKYVNGLLEGNDEEADDRTQMTFIRAWQNLPTLHDPKLFKIWLYRIARNLAYDYWREVKKISFLSLENLSTSTTSISIPQEDVVNSDLARLALTKVEIGPRECLLLHLEGFSHQEIAEELLISPGSVGTYISKARKQFREAYNHLQEEDARQRR